MQSTGGDCNTAEHVGFMAVVGELGNWLNAEIPSQIRLGEGSSAGRQVQDEARSQREFLSESATQVCQC